MRRIIKNALALLLKPASPTLSHRVIKIFPPTAEKQKGNKSYEVRQFLQGPPSEEGHMKYTD